MSTSSSDKKKKRKVRIAAVGTGDPTMKLVLYFSNSENEEQEDVVVENVQVLLGEELLVNMSDQRFSLEQEVTIMSQFFGPDYDQPFGAQLTFESENFEFELDNSETIVNNNDGGEIAVYFTQEEPYGVIQISTVPILAPSKQVLESGIELAIHYYEADGNNIFLYNDNNDVGLVLRNNYNSYNSKYNWIATDLVAQGNGYQCRLKSQINNTFLAVMDGEVVSVLSGKEDLEIWQMSRPEGKEANMFYFFNPSSGQYLSGNAENGTLSLADSNDASWYIHMILPV